nr:hypothetical protein Iba_chr05dCG14060 [Ipomoea batatas]
MPPKTRSKERAKKTKHDREGSSSGARQGVSDLVAPGGRGLPHLNAKQREKVEELQERGVSGGFYFDYALLDAYGCWEEVERMMSMQYWERLFSWRDDTYEPLSIIQLGERIGHYTHEETMLEEWGNLPTDFDSDVAAEAYWDRITNGQGGRFTGVKQNTSKIVSPALKMMKLLLNLTFGGRNKNLHKVYRFDLFHLWSLEMNEPIQMACMVQQMFHSQKNPKCPPPRGEPQQEQEPVVEGGQDVPPEYADYPPVHDWASMRALQIQLHTHSMDTFNKRMNLQHEELMRHNEAIVRQNEAIERQHEAYARQEERQQQQFQAIEQLRLWMEHRFPPPSQGNLSTSPLSSVFGSPPPSPKGIPRTEMMVPRHTLERGETSRGNHDDSSSEEGEGYNMEYAYREFVATLEVDEEVRDRRFPSIKFKLFNKEYNISSDALGNLLGFYTLADQGQAWYANLVEDFENELQEDLFWWSIARPGVTWRASYTSARYIKVPELLILWHSVARSWLGRRTRNDNITRSELFILWSMYTKTPVHMRELCKRILKRQSYEDSENIFTDPFVSRLAEALGFGEALSQEVVTTTMRPIDMEECVHLGLRFNDTMEETRERERELWDTIRRLETE